MVVLGHTIQQQGHCSLSIVQCGLSRHSAFRAQRLRALLAFTNSFRGMDVKPCNPCKNYCEQGEEGGKQGDLD